jgi:hypothetical protein
MKEIVLIIGSAKIILKMLPLLVSSIHSKHKIIFKIYKKSKLFKFIIKIRTNN